MTAGTTQLVLLNITTIENLTHKAKVWQLAVLNPRPETMGSSPSATPKVAPLQVTYGPPAQRQSERSPTIQSNHRSDASENRLAEASPPLRTFSILKTRPGENPWDLGKFKNFKSVMGDRWWDWFLPIKRSPCCNHDHGESAFLLGTVVDRMRREAGISPTVACDTARTSRPQSHRSHRSSAAGDAPLPQGRGHNGHHLDGSRHSGKGRRDRRRERRGQVESA
jgi:palmitoyltransferase